LIAAVMMFSVASGVDFYMRKVGTCEFYLRLFPEMQTSVSGFLFFLVESKYSLIIYLVSGLDK